MKFFCQLCHENIQRVGGSKSLACLMPNTIRSSRCWGDDANPLLVLCAKTLIRQRYHPKTYSQRAAMLHNLGINIKKGEVFVRDYLISLHPEERYYLFRFILPELAAYLSTIFATIPDFEVHPSPRKISIPETLPSRLSVPLHKFRDKTQAQFERLNSKGHSRSLDYVWYILHAPIRFAEHLHEHGIESWDIVRKRDIVEFFKDNPGIQQIRIFRFMRYVNEGLPFRETRGRIKRSKGVARKNAKPPVLVSPDELDEFIESVRAKGNVAEYLLAWLICRMGMMASSAYNLSINRVRINEMGRVVIRPALVWVTVPRHIENIFCKVIDEVIPNWKEDQSEQIMNFKFFHQYIPSLSSFNTTVMHGRTRILRASGVFAAMMKGNIDRVTLCQTMGVSMPFIVKLEQFLSVDMHRSLSSELVKNRNDHILGIFNE